MRLVKNLAAKFFNSTAQSRGASTISKTPQPSQWTRNPLQHHAGYTNASQAYGYGGVCAQAIPPQLIERGQDSFGNVPPQHPARYANYWYFSQIHAQPQLQSNANGYGGGDAKAISPMKTSISKITQPHVKGLSGLTASLHKMPTQAQGQQQVQKHNASCDEFYIDDKLYKEIHDKLYKDIYDKLYEAIQSDAISNVQRIIKNYSKDSLKNALKKQGESTIIEIAADPKRIKIFRELFKQLCNKFNEEEIRDIVNSRNDFNLTALDTILMYEEMLKGQNQKYEEILKDQNQKDEDTQTEIKHTREIKEKLKSYGAICGTGLGRSNGSNKSLIGLLLDQAFISQTDTQTAAPPTNSPTSTRTQNHKTESRVVSNASSLRNSSLAAPPQKKHSSGRASQKNSREEANNYKTIQAGSSTSYNMYGSSNSNQSTTSEDSRSKSTLSKANTQEGASPQLTDSTSAEEFTKNGYEDITSTHKNPSPAPTLQLSANAPHKFCSRHGALQRRPQRPYNTALANGEHTLLPYCYYKEKNGEVSMCL